MRTGFSLGSALVVIASSIVFAEHATAQDAIIPSVPVFKGVLTYHNDNLRTGRNPSETTLTIANVNSTKFGKLFVINTDGKVDAEPLYAPNIAIPGNGTHNMLFIGSEHGTMYGFDADTGAQIWQKSMPQPGETPSDDRGCSQVTPEIGVTATPVIDLAIGPHGTIYVVSMSKSSDNVYHQRLHALDIANGTEQLGGPVEIAAQYPGTGDGSVNGQVIFNPGKYKERAGLLLLNHRVYLFFTSHCDFRPYTGWIMSYNEATLAQKSVLNITPNGNEGSIWQAGAGPAADGSGNIYFLTANGTFDLSINGNGFPANGDYGNAFMKLSTKNGKLAVADYFNMWNTTSESNQDQDLGSGGAMLLPNIKDSNGTVHHLAVGAGKDAHIYLVNRDNMGKFNPSNNNQIYQDLTSSLGGSVFSSPAFFNNRIYYGAVGDTIKAFAFNSNGQLNSTPESHTSTSFPYPGATPSISGTISANAILWAVENSSVAVLHAYHAKNLAIELYNSSQAAGGRDHFGAGNKFITPMIANGKVYVGTTNGVGVFGLLP